MPQPSVGLNPCGRDEGMDEKKKENGAAAKNRGVTISSPAATAKISSVIKKPSSQRLIPENEGATFCESETDIKEYRTLMVICEISISRY